MSETVLHLKRIAAQVLINKHKSAGAATSLSDDEDDECATPSTDSRHDSQSSLKVFGGDPAYAETGERYCSLTIPTIPTIPTAHVCEIRHTEYIHAWW